MAIGETMDIQARITQEAKQQFETITQDRLFVLMHVQLGSDACPPCRKVTTYMATRVFGALIGTECTFVQEKPGSTISFTPPRERTKLWDEEVTRQYLQD